MRSNLFILLDMRRVCGGSGREALYLLCIYAH